MIITGARVNAQSCPTLSGHMDCNSPVSSVHGIFQARILELIAVSFSGSSQSKNKTRASCISRRILYRRATFEALTSGTCACLAAQSCPILCDPMDCSLQGSSVHGILQARILEWVVISFSRGSSRPRDCTQVS